MVLLHKCSEWSPVLPGPQSFWAELEKMLWASVGRQHCHSEEARTCCWNSSGNNSKNQTLVSSPLSLLSSFIFLAFGTEKLWFGLQPNSEITSQFFTVRLHLLPLFTLLKIAAINLAPWSLTIILLYLFLHKTCLPSRVTSQIQLTFRKLRPFLTKTRKQTSWRVAPLTQATSFMLLFFPNPS